MDASQHEMYEYERKRIKQKKALLSFGIFFKKYFFIYR